MMIPINSAHWHLVLNHVPILGSMFGVFLAIWMYFRGTPEWDSVALWWFVAMAVLAIPVYLTGEPAEELVEGLPGVSHDAIEHHEYWAMWAFTLQEITGVFALGVLGYRFVQDAISDVVRPVFLGLVLVTAGLMGYTATLGGHIHHPETRPGFTPPEEHEEEHEDESAKHQEPTSYPGTIDLDTKFTEMLRKEMRKIETGMNQLLMHLIRGNGTKAAEVATNIHQSFILKQELSKKELKQLQQQLPEGFVKLDKAFHKTAAELAGAAKSGRMDEAMERYHRMTSSCVTCHTRYARDRFSGFEPKETNGEQEE